MDKYEYKVRADEIKSLIADGEYAEAVKIADTIDWRRVKSVMMLCTISDLYKINRRYEESRDILLLAYERHTGGRLIVYSLCELSLKLEEYVQAIEYYKEFVQLAPKDSGRYILQYKIYEAQDVSLEERIAVLEELKKKDYREKWAYELAYLYHRVGLGTKCVEECNEMYLWFGEGRYVVKALELKKLHEPLTAEQEAKLQEMTAGNTKVPDTTGSISIRQEASEVNAEAGEYTGEEENVTGQPQAEPSNDLDIQVKTVDVSEYNTINLQKELAESMKEFLQDTNETAFPMHVDTVTEPEAEPVETVPVEEATVEDSVIETPDEEADEEEEPETMVLPMDDIHKAMKENQVLLNQDTDEIKLISDDDLSEVTESSEPQDRMNMPAEQDVSEEVFFGNTAEITPLSNLSEQAPQPANVISEQKAQSKQVIQPEQVVQPKPVVQQKELTPETMSAMSNTGIIGTFVKPSGYDDILSQEYDGQISLVVPESEQIEKQITGQISIEDVMNEWERMKKENEAKRLEDVRRRVHMQTDTLLADFDESTKSGVLEQLEKVMMNAVIKEEEKKAEESRPKVVKISDIIAQEKEEEKKTPDVEPVSEVDEQEDVANTNVAAVETDENADLAEADTTEQADLSAEATETTEVLDIEEADEAQSEDSEDDGDATEEEDDEPVAEQDEMEAESVSEQEKAESEPEKDKPGAFIEKLKHPQPEADKYKCRELSDVEKEEFGPYIHHKRTKKQIVETLDNISMAAYTGNVIITGEEGTGTITLAKLLVREIQTTDSNFSGKVAKISGANLNKKNVTDMLTKLANGALIIEKAGKLNNETVTKISKGLETETSGIIILLEDTKENMSDLLKEHNELTSPFNLRIDVEALDDQTLVRYAKQYADELEYSIDELGILALHTRIADMQTSDHEVTISEVEEIVEEAIYYADKKTPKHFLDVLFGKRYDEEDMIILRERDFMHY